MKKKPKQMRPIPNLLTKCSIFICEYYATTEQKQCSTAYLDVYTQFVNNRIVLFWWLIGIFGTKIELTIKDDRWQYRHPKDDKVMH